MPVSPARSIGAKLAAALLAASAVLVLAAPADARIIEVGPATLPPPSCPDGPCRAVTRTTGYQVRASNVRDVYKAPRTGRIVALTLRLGRPTTEQKDFFDRTMGGRARASLTVLWLRSGLRGQVRAQGETHLLDRYFGSTVQIPLQRSVPVKRGQYLALTVPTWAPVLALGFPESTDWRASRRASQCEDFTTQTRLRTGIGLFQCRYRTAQLTFSATLVTEPSAASSRTTAVRATRNPTVFDTPPATAAGWLTGGAAPAS